MTVCVCERVCAVSGNNRWQSREALCGSSKVACVSVSLIDCGKRKFELVDMFEIINNHVGVLFCSVLFSASMSFGDIDTLTVSVTRPVEGPAKWNNVA